MRRETAPPRRSLRSGRTLIWVLGAAVLLAAGTGAGILLRSRLFKTIYVYSDRSSIREPEVASQVRSVLWAPPREIPGTSVPPTDGTGEAPAPAIVPSRSTLLVVEKTTGRGLDIFARLLESTGWSEARPLAGEEATGDAGINSAFDEVDPALSADGTALYFASNRPGGLGGLDLYVSRWSSGRWEAPRNLGRRVNSPYDERGAAPHPAGAILAFSTTRPRGFLLAPPADWSEVLLESWRAREPDLAWTAGSGETAAGWSDARPAWPEGGRGASTGPCFSPAGDFLYFASNRDGGLGGFDLWRARALVSSGSEGPGLEVDPPQNLGRPLNSGFDETSPRLFLDGFALAYEVSDEAGTSRVLLETRTREVNATVEFASATFEAMASNLARVSLLLLAGVVLLMSIFVLIRYRHVWQVTLLARCAVVAVSVHLLMLYGFYFWVVGEEIVTLARKQATAEVTVERILQSRISLETNRLAAQLPEPAPEPLRVKEHRVDAAPTPEPLRTADVEPLAAVLPEATALEEWLLAPRADEVPRVLEPPEPQAVVLPAEAPRLPDPPRVDSALPEPSVPLASAVASPRSPIEPAPTAASSPPEVQPPPEALQPPAPQPIEQVTTQVQGPSREELFLPPLARPVRDPAPIAAELPVPHQAPRASPEEQGPGGMPAVGASSERIRETWAASTTEPPRIATTEAAGPEAHWRSAPQGIDLASREIPEAREIPAAEIPPIGEPPPVSGSLVKLPESLPRAEVAARETIAEAGLEPRPAERLLERGSAPGIAASAPIRAAEFLPEVGPRTAPATSLSAITGAAMAPLDPEPRPGALSMQPAPPAAAPTLRLPEPGGASSRSTSPPAEVADILGLRASPVAKATFRPDSGGSAAPTSVRIEPEESPMPAPSEAPPPLVVRPSEPWSATSQDESPRASPGEVPSVAKLQLPEMPPELEGRADLRTVRTAPVRNALLRGTGGTEASEAAVSRALAWLSRHQSIDGRWDVDGFDAACRGCRSPGFLVHCDAAVTALAVLCFLGQNHTPTNAESPYRRNVEDAIEWLLRGQDAAGLLSQDDDSYSMYTHGIAALALSEAYILTRDETMLAPLRRAAQVIISSQHPTTGGWRYKPQPPIRGDTSITGWQVLALTSLRSAGIEIPESTFERARHWLDEEVAGGDHGGIYGYTKPDEPRVAMVAEGMYARLLLGGTRTDRNIEEAARYIHAETQGRGHLDNLYLLYYGNLALYNYQGWIWERWNSEVREYLVRAQKRGETLDGSWDPSGPWTETGGRVLSTCFATLTLEVYYRYLPLYWRADRLPESR